MILRRLWHGLDEVKGPTVAAALLAALAASCAALAASCSLNVGGLEAGTPGATGSGAAGGMSAATEATAGGTGGTGGAGAGGAGGASSASSAGGGTSTTFLWHSYDVTVDEATGALSVPGDARGTTPAATLTVYQADSPAGATGKVELNSYHEGPHIINANEDVGWYVTQDALIHYPYIGRSALERDLKDGAPEPLSALDLQVSLKDYVNKPVFVAFEVPIDGHYRFKELAVRRVFKNEDPTVLLVHLKKGGDASQVEGPLEAGIDEKWNQDTSPYEFGDPLVKGNQIVFEINQKGNSLADAIELAWTIEATVP